MRLAQVVAVHPSRRTVDLVFADTGLRVAEAHVLSSLVASDAGEWDFPSVPKPQSEQSAGGLSATGRQLMAGIDFVEGRPVVMGFFHPMNGQMAFKEDDRQVYRHQSGVVTTIAPDGSIETWHPSGSYFRMGTGPHQSLASISANQNWVERSDAPKPTITVISGTFSLTIDPSGNISLTTSGNVAMNTGPVTWTTSALQVTGQVIAGYGTGDQITLQHHTHGGVQTGGGHTIVPDPGT